MTETLLAVEPSQNPENQAARAAAINVPESREVDELEVARKLVRQARLHLRSSASQPILMILLPLLHCGESGKARSRCGISKP